MLGSCVGVLRGWIVRTKGVFVVHGTGRSG